ncbi:hypothetical protein FA95DRAFT_1450432, partial [Auriscalpium vulgare]
TPAIRRPDNVYYVSEESTGRVVQCRTLPKLRPVNSDNFPILTELDIQRYEVHSAARRNFRETDWKIFQAALRSRQGTAGTAREITTDEEFDRSLATLENALSEAVQRGVPHAKTTPYSKRWWTKSLTDKRCDVQRL